jgi:hypothetical protein
MAILALKFIGRLGNCMFQYATARAYAERHGLTLQTEPWIGQQIFNLSDPPIAPNNFPMRDENTLSESGEGDIVYRSYSQQQKCLIYTRQQVRGWFAVSPELKSALSSVEKHHVVCHRRLGDYQGYGYVICSLASYQKALTALGLDGAHYCTEENPIRAYSLPNELSFLPDFWAMCNASVLLRANSCFSWWAGTLGHGRVYSPVITGLHGGIEHDVQFVEGNHPRFANLDGITDLSLPIA